MPGVAVGRPLKVQGQRYEFKLPDDLRRAAERLAEAGGAPLADIIRGAILRGLPGMAAAMREAQEAER